MSKYLIGKLKLTKVKLLANKDRGLNSRLEQTTSSAHTDFLKDEGVAGIIFEEKFFIIYLNNVSSNCCSSIYAVMIWRRYCQKFKMATLGFIPIVAILNF
jgi:hypothetical protein